MGRKNQNYAARRQVGVDKTIGLKEGVGGLSLNFRNRAWPALGEICEEGKVNTSMARLND